MHAVQRHLGINAGIVEMVCEGINNCKTGISRIDGHHYKFEYRKSSIKPPEGGLIFFQALLRGGLFNLAKRITCTKNTVV